MKVKITRDEYRCAPNGFEVQTFHKGDVLEGAAAQMALADKAGARVAEKKSLKAAPENK